MRKNFIFFEAIHASLLKVCNCGIQKAKITKHKEPFVILQSIKTHGIVSYGPRNPGRATDKCALHKSLKKFCFYATVPEQNFLWWGSLHSKFELNPLNRYCLQSLLYFLHIFLLFITLFDIAIIGTYFVGLPRNLEHY